MAEEQTKRKFVVSCDTCADMPRTWYENNDVKYIIMKRIINGEEIAECFDKDADFDNFYAELKKGEMPTTVQINAFEYKEHFDKILKENKDADIVHISLSSGLSNTLANGQGVAAEYNAEFEKSGDKRRVYVIDSLTGTVAIGQQVEQLVFQRDKGAEAVDAVKYMDEYKMTQHGWIVVADLFHLKRGGRLSGSKAVIGSMLNIKPVIHLPKSGKLAMENKVRGNVKAVQYLLSCMDKYGKKYNPDFENGEVWIARTSQSELYDLLLAAIREKYPNVKLRAWIIGPVIGTHLGCGGIGVLFNGGPRLDIQ